MRKSLLQSTILRQFLSVVVIFAGAVACTKGAKTTTANSSGLSNLKVKSASISMSDHGMLLTSTPSASLGDNLLRVRVDGTLAAVSFEVLYTDPDTGATSTRAQSISITAIKTLNDQYIALALEDLRVGILDKNTGDVYDVSGVSLAEMQMDGTNVYSLNVNTGQLFRVDLSDPSLTIHNVNEVGGQASNTGFVTDIYSMINDFASPFKFLGFNQVGSANRWPSPSFVVLNGAVLAFSGPSGGPRVMYFQDGQSAFDCNLSTPFSVGGGSSGGVIQGANKSLYQIRNVTNPVASDYGLRLVQVPFSAAGNCIGDVTNPANIIADMGTSHSNAYSANSTIGAAFDYAIGSVERFFLDPNGFLQTADDASGGVSMTWTNLDLSAVPTEADLSAALANGYQGNRLSVVEGNTLYYLKIGTIYSQRLVSGSSAAAYFTTADEILDFTIVAGHLFYVTADGIYSVDGSGGTAQLVKSGGKLESSAMF